MHAPKFLLSTVDFVALVMFTIIAVVTYLIEQALLVTLTTFGSSYYAAYARDRWGDSRGRTRTFSQWRRRYILS